MTRAAAVGTGHSPLSEPPLRWGVLSAANIARVVTAANPGRFRAVAGRDPARTAAFAAATGIERTFDGYSALLASNDIDAVYVALPAALHTEWVVAVLNGRDMSPRVTALPLPQEEISSCRREAKPIDCEQAAPHAAHPLDRLGPCHRPIMSLPSPRPRLGRPSFSP